MNARDDIDEATAPGGPPPIGALVEVFCEADGDHSPGFVAGTVTDHWDDGSFSARVTGAWDDDENAGTPYAGTHLHRCHPDGEGSFWRRPGGLR